MVPENRELCPGVRCVTLPDHRFKSARLTVALFLPLRQETAEAYAVLSALLTRACRRYPDFTALHRHLNRLYGASVSGDVIRVGEAQVLILSADCTADRYALNGETITADCAALLCDMLFDPALEDGLFRAADVEIERRCLAEAVRAEINEKGAYARRQAEKLLCPHEAYSIGRFGSVDRIEALTPAAVTEAWHRALREATVQIAIQDRGALPAVEEAFRRGFCAVPDRAPVPCPTVTDIRLPELRRRTERMDVNQCKLVLGFRTGCAGEDDGVPAMRLMCALLGGTATSLLMKNVREKLSLCYYCSSRCDRTKGIMLVQSGVDPANVDRTEEEILKQIDTIRQGAFTDGELEDARRVMVQAFESVSDSQSAIGAWYVAQGLSPAMATPDMTKADILAVTREQVEEAARRVALECVYTLSPKEVADHG